MKLHLARSTKAQLKIQEMAFVLVAIMILFGLVALFYFSIRLSDIRGTTSDLRGDEAQELIRKLTATPEFSWSDCANCLDADKALMLKDKTSYKGYWNLDYLVIEKIYPVSNQAECTKFNYPDCNKITIINKNIGTPKWSFVSLCRQEQKEYPYIKCELARVYATGEDLE